jgi:hypothetical protein
MNGFVGMIRIDLRTIFLITVVKLEGEIFLRDLLIEGGGKRQ